MSLTMTVDASGKPPSLDWPAAAKLWTEKAAPLGQSMLRARAPFRTGAFRQSIDEQTVIGPGVATVTFYSEKPYARWIVGGTQPHVITARNARALRWLGPGGTGVHFARSVNHPGTKPNEFAAEAMGVIGPAVAQMFAYAVRESMDL